MRMKTSIVIDRELWKRFRMHSLEKGQDASEILERLIRKEIKHA